MRKIALLFLFTGLMSSSFAQIAKIELDKGTPGANVEEVVIAFKMHVDVGYTDWAEGILQKYKGEMLRTTLKIIDDGYALPQSERLIWTIPAWPLKYMIENCPDDLKMSLNRAVREGRITPLSVPFTYETEASDYETLVRGLAYSDEIRRSAGRELARDAKLTDVPSQSHVIPTLLKNAGIEFLYIGCNPGSKSPGIPILSQWEGPDGKRVVLFNWPEYYGSGVMPPKNWPYKTWLAMIHTHENTGAPTLKEVEAVVKEAREKMPHARIRIGELKDFYDLLMKENPKLPVIKGDMPDTWIHGYSSDPVGTKTNRQMHQLTYVTEALNNLLSIWGVPTTDQRQDFASAIENQILYDEHTFGVALSHGNQQYWSYGDEFQINKSLGNYDYAETSWNEKQNRAVTAERIVKPILRKQMRLLANQVAVDGKRVVVYNPEPWIRTDRVEFFTGIYQPNFIIHALKDHSTGEIIPAYNRKFLLSFDAKNVPAMGYKTYEVITDDLKFDNTVSLDSLNQTIENRFFKISVNPKDGSLASVIDKATGRELVDHKSDYAFAGVFRELYGCEDLARYNRYYTKEGQDWASPEMGRPYDPVLKHQIDRGKCLRLNYEQMSNGVRISAICETEATSQPYIVNYMLYAEEPYVDIVCGVNAKLPDARPEGLWLSFPFAMQSPAHKVFRLGGIVNPATDFIDYTNQYYYYTNGSVALVDKNGAGVALDNPEAPGISIDSTGLYRFGRSFTPKTGLIFANMMNTQWGTNFTEWVQGSFHMRYRIRSFAHYDPAKDVTSPALEARSPLIGAYAEGRSGILPIKSSGVEVSEKGVYVTAFQKQQDCTMLRLWEQAGKSGTVVVTLPEKSSFKKAELCNLRGVKTGKTMIIKNNKLSVPVGANEPVTLLLAN